MVMTLCREQAFPYSLKQLSEKDTESLSQGVFRAFRVNEEDFRISISIAELKI